MRYLYTLLMILGLPFFLIRLYLKGQKSPKYRKHWNERLGLVPFSAKGAIWIHAVSVGESIAAMPLIRKLIEAYPDRPIVVTSTTPTGRERVKIGLGDTVKQSYFPFDIPFLWSLFFLKVKPAVLVTMETELWPNLFHRCARHKIPVILANGRMSENSMEKYQTVKWLTKSMMKDMSLLCVQTEEDKSRFIALGAEESKIQVLGNIKFDLSPSSEVIQKSASLRKIFEGRLVWMVASTHAGEELILFEIFKRLKVNLPSLLLVVAPRHPERFMEVESLAREEGFHVIARSSGAPVTEETDVFVINSMGELLYYYGVSDVAFVGGSLVPVGGHNLLEPAVLGVPVLTGPYMENFVAVTRLLTKVGAAIQVGSDPSELEKALQYLLSHPEKRTLMGQRGKAAIEKNRGATDRHFKRITSGYLS